MSDERRMSEVEEMLRAAGAPEDPPAHCGTSHAPLPLEAGGDVVRLRSTLRMDNRFRGCRWQRPCCSRPPGSLIGVGGNNMSVDRRISSTARRPPAGLGVDRAGSPNGAI
jgi:hypothetical protein